jgi:predicted 2-oxoglutarate/Fe(II)-dependent dioxygenase YbiX
MNEIQAEHIGLGVLRFPSAATVNSEMLDIIDTLRTEALKSHYTYVYDENGDILHATNLSGHRFTPEEIDSNCVRINNFNDLHEQHQKDYFANLENELYAALINYANNFPMALPCLWWKTKGHVLSYSDGASLGLHADNDINYKPNFEPDYQLGTKHVLAAIAYLNDDYEGGEIEFPYLGIKYAPKAGDILMFPANFIYAHEVNKITKGTRYAYLGYFGQGSSDPEHGVTIIEDSPNIYSGQVWMNDLFIDYSQFLDDNGIENDHNRIPLQRAFHSSGTRKEIRNAENAAS